jgi:hypothetical protein
VVTFKKEVKRKNRRGMVYKSDLCSTAPLANRTMTIPDHQDEKSVLPQL